MYPPPAPGPVWALSIKGGELHLQTAEGGCSTCEKLTILINGGQPIAVSVSDNLIRLQCGKEQGGPSDFLRAAARKVSRTGPNGTTLVLEGDARLVYVRQGKKIDVSTDLLSVNPWTGQVISEMSLRSVTPVTPCCSTGSSPARASKPQPGQVPPSIWTSVSR